LLTYVSTLLTYVSGPVKSSADHTLVRSRGKQLIRNVKVY